MARLVHRTDPEPVTVAAHASNYTALMAFTAPSNQKLAVRVAIYGKGLSAGDSVQYQIRRGSDLSGATTGNLTQRKVNSQDDESPAGVCKKFTVQPSDVSATNGTIVDGFTRKPSESVVSPQFIVNGGETYVLWGKTTTGSAAADIIPTVEE